MRKIAIAAAALLSLSMPVAWAAVISPEQALTLAGQQAGTHGMRAKAQMQLQHTVADADGTAAVYVFTPPSGTGFMIVAADDAASNVLLGYSDTSTWALNADTRWWLDTYARSIASLRHGAQMRLTPAANASRTAIDPMTTTLWNQSTPYNNLCPMGTTSTGQTERCPTGCVATAIAQVMDYHKWPVRGKGSHSYRCKNVGRTLSFDFGATTFEWDEMLPEYTAGHYTDAQATAVATLMFALGVATEMEYGPTGSGSNYFSGAEGLIDYFDYDCSMQVLEREYYNLAEWTGIIYNELSEGRPVLYGGQNNEDGHAFVCDGYAPGDYFHINWGWGGMSNGYFLITALDPLDQGIGGSSAGYNIGQDMLIGLRRPVEGSQPVPSLLFMSGFGVAEAKVSHDGRVDVADAQGIASGAVVTTDVRPGLKLTASNGTVTYVSGEGYVKLEMGQGVRGYSVEARHFPTEGTYTVTPAFETRDGRWHDARVVLGATSAMTVNCSRHELEFAPVEAPTVKAADVKLSTAVYAGEQFQLTATLTAEGGEYYGEVAPMLLFYGQEVATATPIAVDLAEGESREFVWISAFSTSVEPGEYTLGLLTQQGHLISEPIAVTVKALYAEPEAMATNVTFGRQRSGDGTAGSPAEVDFADFSATIDVECVQGYFGQTVSGYVFYDTNTVARTLTGNFVGLEQGGTASVEVKGSLTDLTPGHTYIFVPWASQQGQMGNPVYIIASGSAITSPEASATRVYPNPMTHSVTVDSPEPLAEVNILAVEGSSAIEYDAGGNYSVTIDITSLPVGLYIVEAVRTDGSVVIDKVIKR